MENKTYYGWFGAVLVLIAVATIWVARPTAAQTQEASVPVSIRIEGSDKTLFDGTVDAANCDVTDHVTNHGEKTYTYSGKVICALDAASKIGHFSYSVEDSGSEFLGLSLLEIGNEHVPADWSQFWASWLNDDMAGSGISTQVVESGDRLLLDFTSASVSLVPLKITTLSQETVSSLFNITVEKRIGSWGVDWTWHGTWNKADGVKVVVDGKEYTTDSDGKVSLSLFSLGTVYAQASGDGFVRSAKVPIEVVAEISPTPTPIPPTPAPTPTPTPSIKPSPVSESDRKDRAHKALAYLKSKQDSTGGIDGSSVTGWSAMAFGADEQRAGTISKNGKSLVDALAATKFDNATDVERQILAVRAAGLNPRSFREKNLVNVLKKYFNNNQIGNQSQINDDIFGVLAFVAAGESTHGNEVSATVENILQHQNDNGLWDDMDMTAAAIQALEAYKGHDGDKDVVDALEHGRDYFKSHQNDNGGFGGNSATTAWVIQAIDSLGENPQDWNNDEGLNPMNALISYQEDNGGFKWEDDSASAFMTAYAVPALLGHAWPITSLSIEAEKASTAVTPTPSPTPRISPTPLPKVKSLVGVGGALGVSYTTNIPTSSTKRYGYNGRVLGTTALSSTSLPSVSPSVTPLAAPSLASSLTPTPAVLNGSPSQGYTHGRTFTWVMFSGSILAAALAIGRIAYKSRF